MKWAKIDAKIEFYALCYHVNPLIIEKKLKKGWEDTTVLPIHGSGILFYGVGFSNCTYNIVLCNAYFIQIMEKISLKVGKRKMSIL